MRKRNTIRRFAIAVLATLPVCILVLLVVSCWTPLHCSRGNLGALPITHVQCEGGHLWVTQLSTFRGVLGTRKTLPSGIPVVSTGVGSKTNSAPGVTVYTDGMAFWTGGPEGEWRWISHRTVGRTGFPVPDQVWSKSLMSYWMVELRGWPWLLPPLLMVWPAVMIVRGPVRRRRRLARGQCAGCGYDLTGNASGVCPECGTAVAAKGTAGG